MSMRTPGGKAAALALTATVLSSACVITIASQEVEGEFQRSLAVGGQALLLDVDTGSGRIQISAGEPGVARISGRIRGRAGGWSGDSPATMENRVRAIEVDPPVVLDGEVLRVGHLPRAERRRVSISYEIVVPANARVQARTGSGALLVEGVAGVVEAKTGSGRVRIVGIAGDVMAETGSGSVELTAVGGDADVRTGSGAIRIEGVDGALRARTGSGSIRAESDLGGAWDLDTGSGSIRVDLPDDAAFEIDAHTGSGAVRSDHPVTVDGETRRRQLRGSVRGGGPRVALRTGSGSIAID